MSRNFKKISVASALVAATTLPTTMVSALETNVKNDSNTPVTLSSERRGWYEEYGYKYYYDDNGELLKGLQEIDGNTYYFYSYDGHMAYSSWYDEDTITDNGLIVTVNKSGIVTNYANIVVGDWTHIAGIPRFVWQRDCRKAECCTRLKSMTSRKTSHVLGWRIHPMRIR